MARSWADLGFDGIEEPEGVGIPSARDWFDQQDLATQRQILGPARLDALRNGTATWDDFATRRSNPDWRPHYTTTRVRDLPDPRPVLDLSA